MAVSRVLGFFAGVLLGSGVDNLLVSIVGWKTGGLFTPLPFVAAALMALGIGLTLRRRATSPALRTAAASGTLTSVALLTVFAEMSGRVDTLAAFHTSAMNSDLRNLVTAQEEFKGDSGYYRASPPPGFNNSTGVRDLQMTTTSDGWTASVSHSQSPRRCTIFIGQTAVAPAVEEGAPACTPLPFRAADHLLGAVLLVVGALLAAIARRLESGTPLGRNAHATQGIGKV
jgi:hypothetical protein